MASPPVLGPCLRGRTVADSFDITVRSFSAWRAAGVRAGVVFIAAATWAGPVYAPTGDEPTPVAEVSSASAARDRARRAWEKGEFEPVPGFCQEALRAGGMAHADVVEAYVRMGSALAMAGKKGPAAIAFRNAALLDPTFKVPPDAGKKVSVLAEKVRRPWAHSALSISAHLTDEVDAGEPFGVDAAVGPAHAPLVESVALIAHDSLAGRNYEEHAPNGAQVHFEVPTRMTLPDATIVVRIEARDAHDNQLATVERHVHVLKVPAVAPPIPFAPFALLTPSALVRPEVHEDHVVHSGGHGFWKTVWPYVLGGVALAAGGAALWLATRPTDDVNVGAARIEVH